MAKQIWNNSIDKHTDWGGDSSTNNYPVSGEKVQEFIKNSLDSKIGELYYDTQNNRYLVFSDAENRDIYLNDPVGNSKLLLGTFDAPFNYSAEITMFTPSYSAVFLGSTGNYIDFSFDVKNKQGSSTGESVTVTYTFIHNATKKVVTESRKYGETVHFNVDEYLLEGSNTIIVGVTGQTTLAATTVALQYNVINLVLTDEINISKVYDISKGQSTLEAFFNISGSGTKTVEWYLDGELLPFVKTEDEIIDVSSSRTKYISLSNLSEGIHNVQVRAYTLVNGEKFYTDTLYREILIKNQGNINNAVAIATNVPQSYGIIKEDNPIAIFGTEQYIPTEIRFATLKTADVLIYLDNELLTSLQSFAGVESTYSIVSNKSGAINIKFQIDEIEREIPTVIQPTTLNIEEITSALSLDFSARGKSNSSLDKDTWQYNAYTGTFNGFHWNAASGWVNNSLIINTGASFDIDIAPLAIDATNSGKTLEFEFSTRNVEDDDAVVCDLTDENGAGILITASEARMTSASGEVVNTRFRSGEMNRISFVINRKTGTTYKGLAFIYINGILSGAVNYGSADNFVSTKTLSFQGSESAQVELRSLRFYDTALSHENILNNYILYQNTLDDMMNIYYRNDIYEDGTVSFSPDKAQHRLPVMIVTGDIQTLEGATSTSTQITVDIDYINEQNPSKSFKMKDAAMRIQGTSSLAYPRKNFRIYTKKVGSTIVYDANGNVIKNKLYSFKDNAQPVDCWCLKADFAESSGTHNTSIAKIWNDVMVNAKIQYKNILGTEVDGYVLRTKAQESALNAGYEYDVRTTIDGFPILLFYKKNANDTNLIFLGKYNFNNDKSTPSVFGFENIPNFNNTKMQCWETKDNGNPLGLFTDISSFDDNWDEAFESRYPDTKTPNTSDLKSFSLWINGVSQSSIATEKWSHLDVYKVAAYYVYLMRFGAVDQTVKNAFLTSEDGQHFFFINYDNDTINGLINTGKLMLDPYINRQTIGSDGEYVYAGHSSVLWNKLEADTEFMDIVSVVDNALFSAGLRYENIISMFNDEQASKWVERVYNQDAEYKYILPYVNSATNNLFMLQGSRSSHRAWWLSKRFALYDSLFASGNYRDRNISFKCLNDTQPGQSFTIEAGADMNYGYGVNNGIRETGISLESNEEHTFTTTDTLNLGDVVKIFAASNIKSLDLSSLAPRLAVLDCSASNDPALGSKLKDLTLGNTTSVNTELSSISGIGVLTSLQNLNIEGYKNITSLDLSKQSDLRRLYAKRSALSSVDFVPGAPVEYVEFPLAMHSLNLNQLPLLSAENIILEGGLSKIHSMTIHGCPLISSNYNFIKQWLIEKPLGDASSVLDVDNIKWENMDVNEFISFSQYKSNGVPMTLRGEVHLTSINLQQIELLQSIWGEDCFTKNADLHIHAPANIYISPTEITINDGESIQFNHVLFTSEEGTVEYRIVGGGRSGCEIDINTGLFTSTETGLPDSTIYVRVLYRKENGDVIYDTSTVTIKQRIYPTSSTISLQGAQVIGQDEIFTWTTTTPNVNGIMIAEWLISGDAITQNYVEIESSDTNQCKIKLIKAADEGVTINGVLTLNLKKQFNDTLICTKTFNFRMANLVYPNTENTTIVGDTMPEDNTTYTWESSVGNPLGDFTVNWSLSDELIPYFRILEQSYDVQNPRVGSCIVQPITAVEFYVKGTVNVTFTYTLTGNQVTVSKEIYKLSDNVIMTEDTNPEVLKCFYNAGLCASQQYMSKQEAEAVQDGQLNPSGSQTGGIFYSNRSKITNFDEFKYFTGLTQIDAYTFYGCKLTSIKIPKNITKFKSNCLRGSQYESANIDEITVEYIENYAFGYHKINILNLNCAEYSCTQAFGYCDINTINVQKWKQKSNFSYSNSSQYPFYNSTINEILYNEGVDTVEYRSFYECKSINYIYLPDSITTLRSYCFYTSMTTPFINIRMSNNIITQENYIARNVNIINFVTFNNLNVGTSTNKGYTKVNYIQGFSINNLNKQYLDSILGSNTVIEKVVIEGGMNGGQGQSFYGQLDGDSTIKNLYIKPFKTYCRYSPYNNQQSFIKYAENLYIYDELYQDYRLANDPFVFNYYLVDVIESYVFRNTKCFKTIDLTNVNIPYTSQEVFKGSDVETIILDNKDGANYFGAYTFDSCSKLKTIIDTSYTSWGFYNTGNRYAFNNISEDVQINSNVFGLFKYNNNAKPTNVSYTKNYIVALNLGNNEFTTEDGAFFEDRTTKKTLTLSKTGGIEDLSERLKYCYNTIVINSNKSDAQFKIKYTNIDGNQQEQLIGVGSNIIERIDYNHTAEIEPITQYDGLYCDSIQIDTVSPKNTISMDYVEVINCKIQHINGELYTLQQWQENEYSVDNANAIFISSNSYNFLINTELCDKKFGGQGLTSILSFDEDCKIQTDNLITMIGENDDYAALYAKNNPFKNGINRLGYLLSTKYIDIFNPKTTYPWYNEMKSIFDYFNMSGITYWCNSFNFQGQNTAQYANVGGILNSSAGGSYGRATVTSLYKVLQCMDPLYPLECLELSIYAENVNGLQTKTNIHFTAILKVVNYMTNEISEINITGRSQSGEFPKNETSEPIERETSFTYFGQTATTTFIQDIRPEVNYTVNLNNQWELSSSIQNPDSVIYDGVYQSFSNKGVNNGVSRMYITISGYTNFKLYIRSNAEGSYDYVVVGNLDQVLPASPTSTGVKAHTSSKQTSGTSISSYTLVEYTNIDGGEHTIEIAYRKDNSQNSGDDRGYVLIPKEQ